MPYHIYTPRRKNEAQHGSFDFILENTKTAIWRKVRHMETNDKNQDILSNTRWNEIFELVLNCTSVFDQRMFGKVLLAEIARYIPYDDGTIYLIDGNGKIEDHFFTGNEKEISKKNAWFNVYTQYYSKLGRFQMPLIISEKDPLLGDNWVKIKDWANEPSDEFKNDYILPRHLFYTLSLHFFSSMGTCRMIAMLDRTSDYPYTASEIAFLKKAYPLLNNFHKNMFGEKRRQDAADKLDLGLFGLTAREEEIANLLCHGLTPESIAQKIHISLSTTYKHIAHIYKKVKVNNRQEFLLKLLNINN